MQLIQVAAITSVFTLVLAGIRSWNFPLILIGQLIFSFCNYCTYLLTQMIVPKIVEKDALARSNSIVASSRNIVNGATDGISGFLVTTISYLRVFLPNIATYMLLILYFRAIRMLKEKKNNRMQLRNPLKS